MHMFGQPKVLLICRYEARPATSNCREHCFISDGFSQIVGEVTSVSGDLTRQEEGEDAKEREAAGSNAFRRKDPRRTDEVLQDLRKAIGDLL